MHTESDGKLPSIEDIHPSTLLLNWRELLCRTDLDGLARQVVAGCAVDELDDVHAVLAPASKDLISDSLVKTIREALERVTGHDFAVTFSRERREDELTVARVIDTEKLKARRAIVDAFKSDPFVQECVRTLGGEVIETSVRPVTIDELKELERHAWQYSGTAGSGSEDAEKR